MFRIGIGSKTSTGGEVIEGNASVVFDGLVASSVGQMATCKACKKGIGPIVGVGRRDEMLPAGPAARSGDYVACGCPPGANVLLAEGTILLGAYGGRTGEQSPLAKPMPDLPCVFAKSCTVPLKTIDAGSGQEGIINFGQAVVLVPLRNNQQGGR